MESEQGGQNGGKEEGGKAGGKERDRAERGAGKAGAQARSDSESWEANARKRPERDPLLFMHRVNFPLAVS